VWRLRRRRRVAAAVPWRAAARARWCGQRRSRGSRPRRWRGVARPRRGWVRCRGRGGRVGRRGCRGARCASGRSRRGGRGGRACWRGECCSRLLLGGGVEFVGAAAQVVGGLVDVAHVVVGVAAEFVGGADQVGGLPVGGGHGGEVRAWLFAYGGPYGVGLLDVACGGAAVALHAVTPERDAGAGGARFGVRAFVGGVRAAVVVGLGDDGAVDGAAVGSDVAGHQ